MSHTPICTLLTFLLVFAGNKVSLFTLSNSHEIDFFHPLRLPVKDSLCRLNWLFDFCITIRLEYPIVLHGELISTKKYRDIFFDNSFSGNEDDFDDWLHDLLEVWGTHTRHSSLFYSVEKYRFNSTGRQRRRRRRHTEVWTERRKIYVQRIMIFFRCCVFCCWIDELKNQKRRNNMKNYNLCRIDSYVFFA